MMGRSNGWEAKGAVARQATGTLDAYGMIQTSRPADPALQFAAALISSDDHRSEYPGHAAKARAGADGDMLLARNLVHVQ